MHAFRSCGYQDTVSQNYKDQFKILQVTEEHPVGIIFETHGMTFTMPHPYSKKNRQLLIQ